MLSPARTWSACVPAWPRRGRPGPVARHGGGRPQSRSDPRFAADRVRPRAPGRRVRIVSEAIWPDRTDEEYPACVEHEALVNLALAGAAADILCPYDAANLPGSVLTDAARNHPTLVWGNQRRDSPSYERPSAAITPCIRPLSVPPDDAEMVVVNRVTGARTARHLAYEFGRRMGLPPQRLDDLKITVQELAVNTIVHAGGSGLLSVWTADEHIVVQTEDGGRITDPLVGRRPPARPRSAMGSTSSTRSPTSCECTAPGTEPPSAPTSDERERPRSGATKDASRRRGPVS